MAFISLVLLPFFVDLLSERNCGVVARRGPVVRFVALSITGRVCLRSRFSRRRSYIFFFKEIVADTIITAELVWWLAGIVLALLLVRSSTLLFFNRYARVQVRVLLGTITEISIRISLPTEIYVLLVGLLSPLSLFLPLFLFPALRFFVFVRFPAGGNASGQVTFDVWLLLFAGYAAIWQETVQVSVFSLQWSRHCRRR